MASLKRLRGKGFFSFLLLKKVIKISNGDSGKKERIKRKTHVEASWLLHVDHYRCMWRINYVLKDFLCDLDIYGVSFSRGES